MNLDGHSAVVALTHDPKLDAWHSLEASSPRRSTSAIGSKKNNDDAARAPARVRPSEQETPPRGPVGCTRPGRCASRLRRDFAI
jgi:hypothetical protein